MSLLGKLSNISIIFDHEVVLQNVKGDIPSDAIIGIVGGNGQGNLVF